MMIFYAPYEWRWMCSVPYEWRWMSMCMCIMRYNFSRLNLNCWICGRLLCHLNFKPHTHTHTPTPQWLHIYIFVWSYTWNTNKLAHTHTFTCLTIQERTFTYPCVNEEAISCVNTFTLAVLVAQSLPKCA